MKKAAKKSKVRNRAAQDATLINVRKLGKQVKLLEEHRTDMKLDLIASDNVLRDLIEKLEARVRILEGDLRGATAHTKAAQQPANS